MVPEQNIRSHRARIACACPTRRISATARSCLSCRQGDGKRGTSCSFLNDDKNIIIVCVKNRVVSTQIDQDMESSPVQPVVQPSPENGNDDGRSSPCTKTRCTSCQKRIVLSVTCPDCQQAFCIRHRVPELHGCRSIECLKTKERAHLASQLKKQRGAKVDVI